MRTTQSIRPAAHRNNFPQVIARFGVLLGLLVALPGPVALAQNGSPVGNATRPVIAGTIDLVEGDVLLAAKAGGSRVARAGEPVFEGDTISTFDRSELHLRMADSAHLAVRENSRLTITAYVANGDEGDRSLIDLAKGAFRAVTGWIGQFSLKAKTAEGRNAYRVRTPLVTIGVRGTDHEPTHLLPGDPRGEAGSYDRVYTGKAVIQTSQGTLEVPPDRAAFHSAAGPRVRPRLLESVPAFFVARRHEQRFIERSREGLRNLPQQREARREAVRFERGAGKAAPLSPPRVGPAFGAPPQGTPRSSQGLVPQPSSARPAGSAPAFSPQATPAGGLQLPSSGQPSAAPARPAGTAPHPSATAPQPTAPSRNQDPTRARVAPQQAPSSAQDPTQKRTAPEPPRSPGRRFIPPQSDRGYTRQNTPPVRTPRPATPQETRPQRPGSPPQSASSPRPTGKAPPSGGRGSHKPER